MGRENILTCCGKEYYLHGYMQFHFNPMGIKRRSQDNVCKTFISSLLNSVLVRVKIIVQPSDQCTAQGTLLGAEAELIN